ncbi:hypothetical protein QBC39DRAFT_357133 [Podospora conica]|nr:hypothetical protein QBC39DRAFT_357133 [Schizothecium conicum]
MRRSLTALVMVMVVGAQPSAARQANLPLPAECSAGQRAAALQASTQRGTGDGETYWGIPDASLKNEDVHVEPGSL